MTGLLASLLVWTSTCTTAQAFEAEVVMDERVPMRKGIPDLPPTMDEVVLLTPPNPDGRLTEPLWAEVPYAPKLEALPLGGPPPAIRTRVALAREGLALALTEVPKDASVTVLVDPGGAMQQWWMLISEPGLPLLWQRCSFDGQAMEHDDQWEPKAAPCRPLPLASSASRRGTVIEALLPWERMERPTTWMKVHVSAQSEESSGAWGTRPSLAMDPFLGIRFPRHGRRPQVKTEADLVAQTLTSTLKGPLAVPGTTWRWTLWQRGRVLDGGYRAVEEDGQATVTMPWPPLENLMLVWESVDSPDLLSPAEVDRIPRPITSLTVATPVSDGQVSLSFEIPVSVAEATLRVRPANGAQAVSTTVALPDGRGAIQFAADPAWGKHFTVEVDGLMEPKLVVMTPREAR